MLRMCAAWFLLIVFFSGSSRGEVRVKLPEKLEVKPGRMVVLKAVVEVVKAVEGDETPRVVRWACGTPGADLLPYLDNQAIFQTPDAGEYVVFAVTSDADGTSEWASMVVVVGTPKPVPPPTPPPGPNERPLIKELRSLLGTMDSSKLEAINLLIALFVQAQKTADDANVKTTHQLAERVRQARDSLIGERLGPVRDRIARELVAAIGESDRPLTDDLRRKIKETYASIAQALEALK